MLRENSPNPCVNEPQIHKDTKAGFPNHAFVSLCICGSLTHGFGEFSLNTTFYPHDIPPQGWCFAEGAVMLSLVRHFFSNTSLAASSLHRPGQLPLHDLLSKICDTTDTVGLRERCKIPISHIERSGSRLLLLWVTGELYVSVRASNRG